MLSRSPHVMFRVLPEQVALLNTMTGAAVALDQIGTRVWQLLERPMKIEDIAQLLTDEYSAPESQMVQDLSGLINELVAADFVSSTPGQTT